MDLNKGVLIILRKLFSLQKSSSLLHLLNMKNRTTNINHENLLMYVGRACLVDLEKYIALSSFNTLEGGHSKILKLKANLNFFMKT